jgi:hypothetical protein
MYLEPFEDRIDLSDLFRRARLDQRSARVVVLRCCYDWTWDRIGGQYFVTRERARQIYKWAIRRLRYADWGRCNQEARRLERFYESRVPPAVTSLPRSGGVAAPRAYLKYDFNTAQRVSMIGDVAVQIGVAASPKTTDPRFPSGMSR